MKSTRRLAFGILCLLTLFGMQSLSYGEMNSKGEKEGDDWRVSVEKPLSALFLFQGAFNGNGDLEIVVAGVTNSITYAGEWGCGEGGMVETPWMEVSLVLDKVYHCSITGENAYGLWTEIKRVPLHSLLDRGGALDKQFNLYKLYVLNPTTGEWEKLCPENMPYWTIDEGSETCHTHTLNFSIQLRRDFGARPLGRPGLKSLSGDEEPNVWTSEAGGVKAGSAPGDENSLSISAPRAAETYAMAYKWDLSMGRLWSGGSAGRIRLEGTQLTTNSFQRAALYYESPTYDTNEVRIRTSLSDTNEIVQIRTPQALVVTTNTSSMSFEVRYYLTNVITGNDTNGFFTISTNASPFVTWKIDSPANSTNSLRISEIRPWITNLTTLNYTNASNLWTLTRGTGTEARIETRLVSVSTTTNGMVITTNRLETQEVKNGSGIIAAKNSELYQSKPWGQFELTCITNDPGGDNLVTTFAYGEDETVDGTYRQLTELTYPDGYWEKRVYYSTNDWTPEHSGRLKLRISPWKDSAMSSDTNDWYHSSVTEYTFDEWQSPSSYTMVNWHLREETFAEWGYDYFGDARTYEEEIDYIEICQDTTQILERFQHGNTYHYGEIIDTMNYTLDAGPLAGQLSSRKDWMLVMDTYDYEYGDYNPTNRTFTVSTNGIDTRQIVFHGCQFDEEAGDLFATGDSGYDIDPLYLKPNFSTKDVNVLNDGQLVLTRRYIYTGGLTNFALIDEVVYQRDSLMHTTNVFRIDPATGESRILRRADWTGTNSVPGDLKYWEQDENGIITKFTYDSLKRIKTVTKTGATVSGYPTQADIVDTFTYDAADRVLSVSKSGGGLTLGTSSSYDKSGRVLTAVDEVGLTNRFGYQLGGRRTSMTNSAGETTIKLNYADRRPASVTGTAQVSAFFDYGLTPLAYLDLMFPKNITTNIVGTTNSTRWTSSTTDQRHKPAAESWPAFQSGLVLSNAHRIWSAYNFEWFKNGPLTDFQRTFDLYDWWGTKVQQQWVTSHESIEYGYTTNRHRGFTQQFQTNNSGHWFSVQTEYDFPADSLWSDNASVSNMVSRTMQRLTGYSSNQVSEVVTYDAHTNQTTALTTVDFTNRLVTLKTTFPQSSLSATQVVVNGLVQLESTPSVASPTLHYYDGLAREIAVRDALGFVSGSRLDATTGQLLATTNKNGQVTSFQYYPAGGTSAGLLYCETGPTGKKTYFAYNSRGQQTHTWGDVPYPEKRDYNQFGDLVSLSTYRGGTLWSGTNWPTSPGVSADVTTWAYDEPTGLLTNKMDAASRSVTYDYLYTHEPSRRILARGDWSTNYYEFNGSLSQTDFFGVENYSTIATNFNRFNLPQLVIDNSGTHVLSYDYAGRLTEDRCTNGLMAGTTLKLRYHPVYGKDQVIVQTVWGSTTNSMTNSFGFDTYGRLSSVTNGARTATYTYLANSDLISATTLRDSGTTVLTTSRVWDFGYRLRTIDNTLASGVSVSRHHYFHDELDRRRKAMLADGSLWDYNYNNRDEVTSAKRFWDDSTPVAGQQFEFAYDPIGNRTIAKEGGDEYGLSLRSEGYGANNLNQITVRTNSTANDIIGAAYATASVTVNSVAPYRKREYFDYPLTGGSTTNAVWQSVTNVATQGANSTTEIGGQALPALTQTFSYDYDGNLTYDGIWTYTWDPENRLIQMAMTNITSVPNAQRFKLYFAYDQQGRRVGKIVSTWNGSAFASPQTNRFVNHGWNLMTELDGTNTWLRSYTWGLDLTGSPEVAGGIGALLMFQEHTNSFAMHFPGYDGNGNVMVLVKTDASITAKYEYGAFGEALRVTGSAGRLNPFRWSTKFNDLETGLTYYGYRYYRPDLGRWIGRDPINEKGGLNLYSFTVNSPIGNFDALGQSSGSLADEEAAAGGGATIASGARAGAAFLKRIRWVIGHYNEIQQLAADAGNAFGDDDFGFIDALQLGYDVASFGFRGESVGGVAFNWAFKKTHGHHSIPKFLGGFVDQALVKIDPKVHKEFHKLLHDELKKRKLLGGLGGSGNGTIDWERLFKANPNAQKEAFDAVLEASRAIDVKHGSAIVQSFWKNIMEARFTPFFK